MYITTWKDAGIFATHYYGNLASLNETCHSVDVTFKLSKEDAKYLNEIADMKGTIGYKAGESSERFNRREDLIKSAKKQFRKIFPGAKVLVLGNTGYVEPQIILVGPKQFKDKINKLANEYEELDWDRKEDRARISLLEKKWQKLWPKKYR